MGQMGRRGRRPVPARAEGDAQPAGSGYGGDLDGAADGLDVAGDGLDGGYLAALDLGDAAFGHAHLLGDIGLGQSRHYLSVLDCTQ